jgi:hypothetical protein
MASNEIILEIDLERLEKGIKDVRKLQRLIDKAMEDALYELIDRLTNKLRSKMMEYGLGDSQLMNRIEVFPVQDGISIMLDSEYAVFVEYGTGIVGKENPHPHATGWIYDYNGHGEKGWWYPTTMADPNPYKWVDPEGQLRAWTKGSKSRPVMYETWQYGRRIATKIFNKHLGRIKV